jgi:hypothetical protein
MTDMRFTGYCSIYQMPRPSSCELRKRECRVEHTVQRQQQRQHTPIPPFYHQQLHLSTHTMSDTQFDNETLAKEAQKQTVSPVKSFLSGGFGGMSAVLVGKFDVVFFLCIDTSLTLLWTHNRITQDIHSI